MSNFWTSNYAGETIKDPKRKFRFRVDFQGLGEGSSFLWWAKTATKPSFQIASTEHKFLNHTFYYPGTVTWQDVTITLVDPTDPDMAASFSAMIEGGGYHPPTTTDLSTMTKSTAASALGYVTVTQIGADGKDLEKWTLWNAFITELKFGDLEYGADDLTEISITLKYDWAKLSVMTSGGSVSNALGGHDFFQ